MRVGIITQPLKNNYGGLLQNYALQYILKKNGHTPITLDWTSTTPRWRDFLYNLKKYVTHIICHTPLPSYKLSAREQQIINRNTQRFINENIDKTCILKKNEFRNYIIDNKIEAVIVGSDQCWRPMFNIGMIENMFMAFTKGLNIRRIAYAASFGVDNWEYTEEQTKTCASLIKDFDLVTVRENTGVQLCEKYLNTKSIHVLDPTLLVEKEVYVELINKENASESKGKLFYYILDPTPEKTSFVNEVAKSKGIDAFTVLPKYQTENRTKENVKREIEECVFPGVGSWLRGFEDSKMVICDSFHGCVFSIIFNKPFWVIANKNRGNSRFNSVLKLFNLEERLLDVDDLKLVDYNKPIDWEIVNQQKKVLMKESEMLLMKYLK